MLAGFWESVGNRLAERWGAQSGPALLFWLGGLLAWAHSKGGLHSLRIPLDWLAREPGLVQLVTLAVILGGIVASSIVITRLTMPVLRFAEGYWPPFLNRLRRWLVGRVAERAAVMESHFQDLAGPVADGTASAQQQAEYVRLDRKRRRLPELGRYQPTRLGNIMRAAEGRPVAKYGLDAVGLWVHLWLVLPITTRSELAAARRRPPMRANERANLDNKGDQ
jgi:hypothetical protein